MRDWPRVRWAAAIAAALITVLVIGIPTDLVANPVFGRAVDPTWWSWPVLLATAVLSGLLTATYVKAPSTGRDRHPDQRSRAGLAGGFLAYLAVGCPVCNKVALLALGYTGALQWFAPLQPFLALVAVALLGYALRRRLEGERSCPVGPTRRLAVESR